MIIDMTGSVLFEKQDSEHAQTKHNQTWIDAGDFGDFGDFDDKAYQEWGGFVVFFEKRKSREDRIHIVESALQDNHMRGVLGRACSRKIRSKVKQVIKDFGDEIISLGLAAERIVDIDRASKKEANDDRT